MFVGEGARDASVTVRWWPVRFVFHCGEPRSLQWFQWHLHTTAHLHYGVGLREIHIAGLVDVGLRRQLSAKFCQGQVVRVAGHLNSSYERGVVDGQVGWVSADGHGGGNEHVLVRESEDVWTVIGDGPQAVARAAVRLARELLRMEAAVLDGVTVHASCATIEGRAVLFLGASGRGKTSLSLAASREDGYLVSGDQTELLGLAEGVLASGFPWVPRLGYGTIAGLGLTERLRSATLLRPQESIEDGEIVESAKIFGSSKKIELTHKELETLLGGRVTDAAALQAVVVLDQGEGVSARVTRPASVLPQVRRELREPDPAFPAWWLDTEGRVPPDPHPVEDLTALLAELPWLHVIWHPARHQPLDVLDRIAGLID